MRLSIIILLTAIFSLPAFSQSITPEEVKFFDSQYYNGKVNISQSADLENFIETHVGLNKKRRGFCGYRVKIYAQNHQDARSQANALRIGFNEDGQEAYVVYIEPNFEVHVGDYLKRFDAVVLLNKIKEKYPESYIIKTVISYPKHN
ncbi:MAG: hypothetical protein PHH30_12085 [Bacteroidales bacterium]|nr:hypothetical protein [Bacteroidales bacterium]